MSSAVSPSAVSFVGQLDAQALDGRYLGPATVTKIGPATLVARLSSGEEVAPTLALAFPFTPAAGDTLLVIGQDERYFVIGVIESTGQTQLRFRGDVDLRAVDGTLDLHGEKGVEVRGPTIQLKSKKLEVLADKATEVFGSAFTRVKELLSVHAGETDTVVAGQWSTRAKRAAITSEEVASINGKEVHLG